jgi:Na+/proline symporter
MNVSVEPWVAWITLCVYGIAMFTIVKCFTRNERTRSEYLVYDRKMGLWSGASSLAVSWIWAPAIFFCSLKAYLQGVPGIFWFTAPSMLCFITFAIVAKKMVGQYGKAVSLPDYLSMRFNGSNSVHLTGVLVIVIIDVVALLFNAFIGAFLLNLLSGISVSIGILVMMGIALGYSFWRGLPASVVTDVVQLASILGIAFIITPWAIIEGGGLDALISGIGGISGEFSSIWNADVAYSFGLPATIALLAVPFADQMFYQRAMSCPTNRLNKMFVLAALLYGAVPLTLSLLGFLGASKQLREVMTEGQFPPILVNVYVVAQVLPHWTLFLFIVMVVCALSSTLDSALCALGLIWGHDIYARYLNRNATDSQVLNASKYGVLAIGVLASVLALIIQEHLNGDVLFNFNGAVAAAIAPPIILSVFWRKTNANSVVFATLASLAIGAPLAWWANVGYHVHGESTKVHWVVGAAVGTLILSTLLTVVGSAVAARTSSSIPINK